MAEIKKTVLKNGVRVLTERVDHVGSASIGVWCQTGSRHELEDEAGITHFIEHMLFKGTSSRTAHEIAEEIEGRGGMLNAFTDKEKTCYYCRVLEEDAGVGLSVLGEMVTESLLDPEELEREKGVVLEEIKRSEDEPGDQVHDLHLQGFWEGHKLGLPVIGTKESVSSFDQGDLRTYMKRRYTGNHIMVTATGKVDHDELVTMAEKQFAGTASREDDVKPERPSGISGVNEIAKDIEQVHFVIGTDGVNYYDEEIYTVAVLDSVLGGGMSSRLFQEVREKRGLAYAIGTYHLTYSAGGAFNVYGGTGMATWQTVQDVVRTELDKIMNDGPGSDELVKIKRQLSGNIVLGLEAMSARMMRMARNELVHERDIPVEETVARINAVTADEVKELAGRFFDPAKMRTTAIGPFDKE